MDGFVNKEKKENQEYQATSMLTGKTTTIQYGDKQDEFEVLDYNNKEENMENAVYANHQHMVEASSDLAADKKIFGDSKSMEKVKKSMISLYGKLVGQIPSNKEEFMEAAMKIAADYEKYINACEAYIKSHNPKSNQGKARLYMVKELYLTAKKEKEYFEASLSAYGDTQYKEGTQRKDEKFLYLLKFARAEVVDVQQVNSQGSTGSIRKYNQDGKTYFFKKTEYTLEGKVSSMYMKVYEDILDGKHGEAYKTYLGTLNSLRQQITSVARGNIDDDIPTIVWEQMLYIVFTQENSARYKAAMKVLGNYLETKKGRTCINNLKIFIGNNIDIHEKLATDLGSPIYTTAVAKYNEIQPGANLTMRAVATSRLDKHLNINGMVDTDSVMIKDEKGIVSTGMRMEGAKGISLEDLYELVEKDKKKIRSTSARFTPAAAKKLQEIILLDYLLAQGDRHGDNVMVDYKKVGNEYIISDVKGIDNDMCLGNLSGEKIDYGFNRIVPMLKRSCTGKIKSKNDCVIQYIHEDTYNKFNALQPETLLSMFADCGLSKDEWKALRKRFDTLKKVLETLHKGKVVLSDKNFSKASMGELFDNNHMGEYCILSLMHPTLVTKSFKNM